MNLNINELRQELSEVQEKRSYLETELYNAFNQEHNAMVQEQLNFNKIKEIKLLTRISFLKAQAEATSIPELVTYSDLIYQRMFEIYGLMQDLEQQRAIGHNEELGQQMDDKEELLSTEESNLTNQLHKIYARKEHFSVGENAEEMELLNTAMRTLSIARGDAGFLERECMTIANKMVLLLGESFKRGELSLNQYNIKKTAVTDNLQFFTSRTAEDFRSQLKKAMLQSSDAELEDDLNAFQYGFL